ncbi:MAG: nuclear transport factor 2 family protein [Acidimicrobiia bacterium]
MSADALRAVADRLEIIQKMHDYAFAIDDRDWDLLASVFLPDAVMDVDRHGTKEGFPAILATISQVTSELDLTHHIVGNASVLTLDGDEATTRCYLWAQHVLRGTPGGDNYVVGGQYRDRFVRTAQGWRIAHRTLTGLWTDGNPRVRNL